MKSIIQSTRQFCQNDLFSALLAVALGLFIVASPATYAAKDSAKKAAVEKRITEKVNINRASIPELTALKGVGERKAVAIVQYRNANGKFKSVDELTEVKGIGEKLVDANRKRIRL